MKKAYLIASTALLIILAAVIFYACKKDTVLNSDTENPLRSPMSNELQLLYQQLPTPNFGNIRLVNGDILQFESKEHYTQVYDALYAHYRAWNDLFIETYDKGTEEELDKIIEELNFDDQTPLIAFEQKYKETNNTLRAMSVEQEEVWLERGAQGLPPTDSIIICPIERTLFSKFYEVCIQDTICQLRSNGTSVLIPIAAINFINQIRNASTSELSQMASTWGIVVNEPLRGNCYYSSWSKSDEQPNGTNYKFKWSYDFRRTWFNGPRTTVTMDAYKRQNAQSAWQKDYGTCTSLGSKTQVRIDVSTAWGSCLKGVLFHKVPNTPHQAFHRSKTQGVFDAFSSDDLIRNDPNESEVLCRHSGTNFTFNAQTGALK